MKQELSNDPEFVSLIETNPFVFPDHLVYGRGGVNFKKLPVEINVVLTPDSSALIKSFGLHHKTNVDKIDVSIIDLNDQVIEHATVQGKPQYEIKTVEPIKGFKIVILKTKDGKMPSFVELFVKGCKNATETTTVQPTTSLPNDCVEITDIMKTPSLIDIDNKDGDISYDRIAEGKDTKGLNLQNNDYINIKFLVPFRPIYIEMIQNNNVKNYRLVVKDESNSISLNVTNDPKIGKDSRYRIPYEKLPNFEKITEISIYPTVKAKKNSPYNIKLRIFGCIQMPTTLVSTTTNTGPTSTKTAPTTSKTPTTTRLTTKPTTTPSKQKLN